MMLKRDYLCCIFPVRSHSIQFNNLDSQLRASHCEPTQFRLLSSPYLFQTTSLDSFFLIRITRRNTTFTFHIHFSCGTILPRFSAVTAHTHPPSLFTQTTPTHHTFLHALFTFTNTCKIATRVTSLNQLSPPTNHARTPAPNSDSQF